MYRVIAERFYNEEFGDYLSYGIAFSEGECETEKISDLSLNKSSVEEFCKLLNLYEIAPNDISEYIEDFLT